MIPYSFFVGFSIPVQRALFAFILWVGFDLLNWPIDFWVKFFWVVALVIAFDPNSVESASFYLSFAAVYFIGLLSKGDLVKISKWRQWARLQLGLFFGLFALNVGYFSKTSLLSPAANLVAIPWMTLLVVPCCLLASLSFLFSKTMALFLFKLSGELLSLLWGYLSCLVL